MILRITVFAVATAVPVRVALAALIAALATAGNGERNNRAKFGPACQEYMRETKMLVPYVF